MRHLSEAEVININKLLQMETQAVTSARMLIPFMEDETLKGYTEASILACEARIKYIQQFINENDIIDVSEVH